MLTSGHTHRFVFIARLLRGKCVVYITHTPLSNHSPAFCIYFLLSSQLTLTSPPKPGSPACQLTPGRLKPFCWLLPFYWLLPLAIHYF